MSRPKWIRFKSIQFRCQAYCWFVILLLLTRLLASQALQTTQNNSNTTQYTAVKECANQFASFIDPVSPPWSVSRLITLLFICVLIPLDVYDRFPTRRVNTRRLKSCTRKIHIGRVRVSNNSPTLLACIPTLIGFSCVSLVAMLVPCRASQHYLTQPTFSTTPAIK